MSTIDIAKLFTQLQEFQVNLTLFHFQTNSYSAHIAAGKLYETIIGLNDELIESLQSVTDSKIDCSKCAMMKLKNYQTPKQMRSYARYMCFLLNKIKWPCSSIKNISDEICNAIWKFIYLSKLK